MTDAAQLAVQGTVSREERIRLLVDDHHDRIWRTLRRLGVPTADVDDATQQVFIVLDRKLWRVCPGSELPFLFRTAVKVASEFRRARSRRRLDPEGLDKVETPEPSGNPEELLALRRERERLDRILDAMPPELRAVFVLFELDGLTMAEIAEATGLRPGTVASRIRRARTTFSARVRSSQAEVK